MEDKGSSVHSLDVEDKRKEVDNTLKPLDFEQLTTFMEVDEINSYSMACTEVAAVDAATAWEAIYHTDDSTSSCFGHFDVACSCSCSSTVGVHISPCYFRMPVP